MIIKIKHCLSNPFKMNVTLGFSENFNKNDVILMYRNFVALTLYDTYNVINNQPII